MPLVLLHISIDQSAIEKNIFRKKIFRIGVAKDTFKILIFVKFFGLFTFKGVCMSDLQFCRASLGKSEAWAINPKMPICRPRWFSKYEKAGNTR
jgi:hypothetical protein